MTLSQRGRFDKLTANGSAAIGTPVPGTSFRAMTSGVIPRNSLPPRNSRAMTARVIVDFKVPPARLKIHFAALHHWQICNTLISMKTLTVRLPEPLAADIEAESRGRNISKSDVVRERLQAATGSGRRKSVPLHAIADLIGSVEGLPADLSAGKKQYLKATGYGRKRTR